MIPNCTCPYCDDPQLSQYTSLDGSHLCQECARREISGLLTDLDKSELSKLRRKVEDRIRKSPALLLEIITSLIIKGGIEL